MPAKDSWGGPAASEPPFVDALVRSGVDVSVETYVYGDKDKPTPLLTRIWRVVRTAFRFRRRLHTEKFDLIHLNTAFDKKTVLRDAISIFIMRPRAAKVFLKIHGSGIHEIPKGRVIYDRAIRYLAREVDGLGVHTHEEMSDLESRGFDPSKFHLVKNAIDLSAAMPDNFTREFKLPGEQFDLLFISRFIKSKGLLETIRACSILRDRGVRFVLNCIGDGPVRGEAEQLVAELTLDDCVRFTGYISEEAVFQHLLNGDIFVFPTSHIEGFPNALFRAVAVGLPIVTTPVRAAAEYLSDPENCLFCTTDPKNIADRIHKLITDRGLRERMSCANTEFGKELSPDEIAGEFLNAYQAICNKR
jgi:glycosyltransferase involved in cell wall biosynthesis